MGNVPNNFKMHYLNVHDNDFFFIPLSSIFVLSREGVRTATIIQVSLQLRRPSDVCDKKEVNYTFETQLSVPVLRNNSVRVEFTSIDSFQGCRLVGRSFHLTKEQIIIYFKDHLT